jgi:glycosyltransferase involved in cell wall biosynthesis
MESTPPQDAAPSRVLYLIGALGTGGAERQLLELCSHLDRAAFTPLVCSLDVGHDFGEEFRRRSIPVVELERRSSADIGRLLRLRRLIRSERPRLVHAFLVAPSLYARLACMGLRSRLQLVISQRTLPRAWSRSLRAADRALTGFADCYLANAAAVRAEMLELAWPQRPRIEVIHNGFDARVAGRGRPREAVRSELGLRQEETGILTVGRLVDEKDFPTLIEGFARVAARPGIRLFVAGEGPERSTLERAARERGLPITLLGLRHDVPDLMRACDLFVLSSKVEGFPNVVGEALLARLPVAATAAGGVPEVVRNGIDGLVVPVGDASSLGHALSVLLDDPETARRMAESGSQRIREAFSIDRMVRRTEALYRSLLCGLRRSW